MNRLLFFALVCLLATTATTLAGKQDFTLLNKTGFDIHEIYVSPHSSNEWEEDVMGKGVLVDGQSVAVRFDRANKAKEWDLKVVDKEGKAIVWEKIDLSEITKLTIHYKDGKASADVE